MGLANSVQCHVEQTCFDEFVQHGIGQLCPIPCQTSGFDEFVQHGIDILFDSFESVAGQASDLLGKLFSQQGNNLLVKEPGKQANNLLAKS
jgi:hypothetical protein